MRCWIACNASDVALDLHFLLGHTVEDVLKNVNILTSSNVIFTRRATVILSWNEELNVYFGCCAGHTALPTWATRLKTLKTVQMLQKIKYLSLKVFFIKLWPVWHELFVDEFYACYRWCAWACVDTQSESLIFQSLSKLRWDCYQNGCLVKFLTILCLWYTVPRGIWITDNFVLTDILSKFSPEFKLCFINLNQTWHYCFTVDCTGREMQWVIISYVRVLWE